MTDLRVMRDRPIGTPGVGFSPKRAKVDEESRQKFLDDVRAVLDRPMAVGLPGAYLIKTNEIQPSGGYTKMVEELPPGYAALDPLAFAPLGITKAKALKEIRRLHKMGTQARIAKGVPKRAAAMMHKVEGQDITDVVESIPQRLWDRIRSIRRLIGDPEVSGMNVRVGSLVKGIDEADLYLHPESFGAGTISHEVVGHEGSRVATEVSKKLPNIRKLREWWNPVHDEMNSLQQWLHRQGESSVAHEVYSYSPDEIFSRFTEAAMERGMSPLEAIVGGHRAVYNNMEKTMSAFRKGLEAAKKYAPGIDVEEFMRSYGARGK